ncbi:hypothetical protein NEUTE2DRAFT_125080 [Neurospora tetrasperma FGSC 2509]|nr:hypothetical protein NEUTE2DRAFT_125080 [Neurospora tetrasperma FGSC 2509]
MVNEDFRSHVRHSTEPRSSWRDMLPVFLIQIAERVKWRASNGNHLMLPTTDADDTLQSRLTLFSAFDGASGRPPNLPRCCSVPSHGLCLVALPVWYTSTEEMADCCSQERPGTESTTACHNGYSFAELHRLSTDITLVVLSTASSSYQEQLLVAWSYSLGRSCRLARPSRAFHFLMFLPARVILALSVLEQVVDAHHQMNVLPGIHRARDSQIEAHHPNLAMAAG